MEYNLTYKGDQWEPKELTDAQKEARANLYYDFIYSLEEGHNPTAWFLKGICGRTPIDNFYHPDTAANHRKMSETLRLIADHIEEELKGYGNW